MIRGAVPGFMPAKKLGPPRTCWKYTLLDSRHERTSKWTSSRRRSEAISFGRQERSNKWIHLKVRNSVNTGSNSIPEITADIESMGYHVARIPSEHHVHHKSQHCPRSRYSVPVMLTYASHPQHPGPQSRTPATPPSPPCSPTPYSQQQKA